MRTSNESETGRGSLDARTSRARHLLSGPGMLTRMRHSRKAGFTLVEIVLSLGIISFAFVGVLGMLPVGLDVSRQAIDTTIVAQIAQQLTTEAQQTDFSRLEDLEAATKEKPYWFDYQGNQTTDPVTQIYKATVDVSTSTSLPSSIVTNRLATVKVCVLNTKSGRTDNLIDPELSRDSRKFVVLIPDNGR